MPASLLSAKIRGIRSYCPAESKSQTIDFMPLTLIIGSNGTGKTTIIESLKFIIAGEEPPLSDSRRNFINGTSDMTTKGGSFASIELEFRNSFDDICKAKRELSKAYGKTATPSIYSGYKIGNKPWISVHKQEEWNRTLPALFNLPNQAILNHVVLCHQDENLWCMGDSSSVKQIFDKIFGCEQYKKEIKHIESELKSAKSDQAIGERDLIRLKEKAERKLTLRADVNNIEMDIEKLTANCTKLDASLKEIVAKKDVIAKDIQQLEAQEMEGKILKRKLEDLNNQQKMVQKTLSNPMIDLNTVSDEELAKMIRDHSKLVEETKTKQAESHNRISALKNDIKKLESKKSSIHVSALALVTGNLSKMSLITEQMEENEHVKSLRSLIDSSKITVEGLINKMKIDDGIHDKELGDKLDELDSISDLIDSKKTEINELFKEHSSLSDGLGESFERNEENKKNVQVRNLMKLISDTEKKLTANESQEKSGDNKLASFKKDLSEIQRKEYELRDERSMFTGSKSQMEKQLRSLKFELDSLSRVDRDYAECLGKVACNRIVFDDLNKLKECFQKSITTFHDQMIVKINEALCARWRQVYRGGDIETIELVDEEISKGKDKKMINYYIAMRKNGIRMKMREKSSAGQKALASIILRMTLAELFVKDFAFIALDEPTANLDLANVQSLAKAIGNYVRRRSAKGANIQWIIITHDEQFLKALDVECAPFYYRTKLDDEGYSNIVKLSSMDIDSGNGEALASE